MRRIATFTTHISNTYVAHLRYISLIFLMAGSWVEVVFTRSAAQEQMNLGFLAGCNASAGWTEAGGDAVAKDCKTYSRVGFVAFRGASGPIKTACQFLLVFSWEA